MKPYPNEELDRMSKREIIRLYKRTVKQFNDAEPVRHGRWIDMGDHVMCGCCGATHYGADKNYCPNCGVKMDLEKENE